MSIQVRRSVRPVIVVAAIGVVLTVWSTSARAATCPHDLCACLGAAGQFGIVGGAVGMLPGKTGRGTYTTFFGSSSDDTVCATAGLLTGISGGETTINGDLLLLFANPKRPAAGFGGYKAGAVHHTGVNINGDLISAGGTLKGVSATPALNNVVVTGATLTDAMNPKLAPCTQAMLDMASASSTLKALTPAQTLAPIKLKGADGNINAGTGVNVFNIDSILLLPDVYRGSYGSTTTTFSTLNINLVPTTETVIINVLKGMAVGTDCKILVVGGDPNQVIINVPGRKGPAIGPGASIDPPILAPNGGMVAYPGAATANLLGKVVLLRGADVTNELMCP